MEQVIIQLIISLINSIPATVDAIHKSKTLSDEEKKQLLFDLNVRLTNATTKVQRVRFKKV